MEKNIQTILDELYTIDPSFRTHEDDLRNVIRELLVSRPGITIDEAFVERLRAQLVGTSYSGYSWFTNQSVRHAVGGILVLLILVVPAIVAWRGRQNGTGNGTQIALGSRFTEVGEHAFGVLTTTGQKGSGENADRSMATDGSYPIESGSGAPKVSAPMMGAGGFGGGGGVSTGMPIRQDFMSYRFVYRGDTLKLEHDKGPVYLRKADESSDRQLMTFLAGAHFDLVSLSSFTNLKVRALDLFENRDQGYTININFEDGSLFINQNWSKWPVPMMTNKNVQDETRVHSLPADGVLVDVANIFLKDHDIGVAEYGTPFVDKSWRGAPETKLFVPDTIVVRYPLKVEGKDVYDEGANAFGIDVGINVNSLTVVSVSGITTQIYDKSSYALETNFDVMRKIAERGGVYGSYPEGGKIVEVTLGTAKEVLMKQWHFAEGRNQELLVPALRFPIERVENGENIYMSAIIVPLVQDFLKVSDQLPVTPPIMYMKGVEPQRTWQ